LLCVKWRVRDIFRGKISRGVYPELLEGLEMIDMDLRIERSVDNIFLRV
jgi:hypothetical protein